MNAKVHYTTSDYEIAQLVNNQISERWDDLVNLIAPQTMAVCMQTLVKTYGFKKKDLEKFLENTKDMWRLIAQLSPTTHGRDSVNWFYKEYGIDLFDFVKNNL